MTTLICPSGSEPQPGTPEYLQILEDIFSGFLGLEWPIAGVVALEVGTVRHLTAICDGPRVDYPEWSITDFLDQNTLALKLDQWLLAHLWDTYCQCKADPSGCGTLFDGLELGLETLNADNATPHVTEGAHNTPNRKSYANAAGTTHVSIGPITNQDVGNILIATMTHDDVDAPTPDEGGWTALADVTGTVCRMTCWYRWVVGGEPEYYHFTVKTGDLGVGSVENYEKVNHTTPFGTIVTGYGTGTPMSYPEHTVVDSSDKALGMASSRDLSWNEAEPAGWTPESEINSGSIKHRCASITAEAPGGYSAAQFGAGNSAHWVSTTVVLQGTIDAATTWYSWEKSGPATYGYAVQNAAGTLLDHNNHGGSLVGYEIEKRWSAAHGGTLVPDNIEWKVYNAAMDLIQTVTVGYFDPAVGASWPCNYTEEPPPPGDPPEGVTDPHAPTPATLAGIADEVHKLEAKLDATLNRLAWMTDILANQATPTAGVFGQAREVITGDFQDVVVNALQAMSNYVPAGYYETLLASGVEGDWEDLVGYPGYHITLTSIPAWVGLRVAAVPFYEVNSRRDQLGWLTWVVNGGHLDYRITVWQDTIAWAPTEITDGLVLHLAQGCVADIYGLTKVYTPIT